MDKFIVKENRDACWSQYQFGNYHVSKVLGTDKIGRKKTTVIAKFTYEEDAIEFAKMKNLKDKENEKDLL